MRASQIVRQLCRAVVSLVDRRRLTALLAAVDALVAGGRLSLTSLGRSLASGVDPKHRIKRIDRLLGNTRLWSERLLLYTALARRLVGGSRRPIVLIDWTVLPTGNYALSAAIAAVGRGLPLYSESHPKRRLGSRAVQSRFLETLARILPDRCKPVIIADAGFKTPFFVAVERRGWDFVVRLRGDCSLKRTAPREYLDFKCAFARAVDEPRSLGEWIPYASGYWHAYRIIIGSKPSKARRRPGFYQRRALEPWLLATTIRSELPRCIVDLYAQRMQIEETFRDAKNARLGWGLEHANSRSPERQDVLLLIATLAFAASVLAGALLEARGLAHRYQANSEKRRRILSLFRIGTYALQGDIELGVRHATSSRLVVQVYVQRPFQCALPFTRLRREKWI